MVDRVDLVRVSGTQTLRRWRTGHAGGWTEQLVSFGRLADGRWYAYGTGDPDGAYVFVATEQGKTLALRLAYRWMREVGGQWVPIPARYDNRGEPDDGLSWVKRGGGWQLRA